MYRVDAARIGFLDLPNWWSTHGRPGWTTDADQMGGLPWTLAGHTRASWQIVEPGRAPATQPAPSVHLSSTPFVFFDSVHVEMTPQPEPPTLDHSLAVTYGEHVSLTQERARSIVNLTAGALGREDNSVTFERGDSVGWLRIESSSGSRGGYGGWQSVNRHRWGFGGGIDNGKHRIGGAYAQRGGAARLTGGEEQSGRGESGYASYLYRSRGGWTAAVRASRGYDVHDSRGTMLAYSRRDAQENRLLGRIRGVRDRNTYGFAVEWRQGRIARSFDGAFEKRGSAVWGRLDWARPLGEGRLDVALGGGDRPGVQGFRVAPAVHYTFVSQGVGGRIGAERMLESVWADLAPGRQSFLQDTWVGMLEVGAGQATTAGASGTGVHLGFRVGQTSDRAIVTRRPVEELWLRAGYRSDPQRYVFGLLTARASWRSRLGATGVEAFALARDASLVQAKVDPGQGVRAHVKSEWRMFAGDLQVMVRADAEGVGPRESEALVPRRLPGFFTFSVTGAVTIAEAILTLSMHNLEDVKREQIWIDSATGVEALGPGRQWRLMLTWKLFG